MAITYCVMAITNRVMAITYNVMDIAHYVRAITHYVMAITHLVMAITHFIMATTHFIMIIAYRRHMHCLFAMMGVRVDLSSVDRWGARPVVGPRGHDMPTAMLKGSECKK